MTGGPTGLTVVTIAQRARLQAEYTEGVVKPLDKWNQNVSVQKFYLGLHFEGAAMGVQLSFGNYIAVQVPSEASIDWNEWIYKPESGTIVHQGNGLPLEYNYLVFRISRYEE
jgi:hypothetical protein